MILRFCEPLQYADEFGLIHLMQAQNALHTSKQESDVEKEGLDLDDSDGNAHTEL